MPELKEATTGNDKPMAKRTVFISYSRSDSGFVKDLVEWLKEAGCTVWQDISGLRGGETWASGIDKAVRASDVMIVVLSPDSNASEWVRKETLLAMNLHKPIVPILFREAEIPVQLVDLQFVDFRGDTNAAARNLLAAITNSADSPKTPFRKWRSRKTLILVMLGLFGVSLIAGIYLSLTTPRATTERPTAETLNSPIKTPDKAVTNAELAWPTQQGAYIADSSEAIPHFPSALSGFKSEDGKDFWGNKFDSSGSIRVVDGNAWEVIPDFPQTMNHCGEGMFMVRWRSGNSDVVIDSTLGYSPDKTSSQAKIGSFGYMLGTNCDEPMFKFSHVRNNNESNIADVHYELKFWQAAP